MGHLAALLVVMAMGTCALVLRRRLAWATAGHAEKAQSLRSQHVLLFSGDAPNSGPPPLPPPLPKAPQKTCWFCGTRPATEGGALTLPFERFAKGKRKDCEVTIDRCDHCKKGHDTELDTVMGMFAGCAVGAVLGLTLMGLIIHWGGSGWFGFFMAVGIGIGLGWGGYRRSCRRHVEKYGPKELDTWKTHPRVKDLLSAGWETVEMVGGHRLLPWHKRCYSPQELFNTERPKKCPVCGSNISTSVGSVVGSMTLGPDIMYPTQCVSCGAWGCSQCSHHHSPRGGPANTYRGENVHDGPTGFRPYSNMKWMHDMCCHCSDELVGHRGRSRFKTTR